MFPGLMAVKFNLFALLVVEGDGGAGAAPATVPTAAVNGARGQAGAMGHHSERTRMDTAGAKACPAPDVAFYRLSFKTCGRLQTSSCN